MSQKRQADRLFEETMFELAERLRLLYSSEGSEEERLARRARIFEDAKESLGKGLEALDSNRYRGILGKDWNNAFVVSYLTYHQEPELWQALYDRFGRDLRATVAWLKKLEGEREPMTRIERWLAEGDGTANH